MILSDKNFEDVTNLASYMIEIIARHRDVTEDGNVDWTAVYEYVQTNYTGMHTPEMAELAVELIVEAAQRVEQSPPPGVTIH